MSYVPLSIFFAAVIDFTLWVYIYIYIYTINLYLWTGRDLPNYGQFVFMTLFISRPVDGTWFTQLWPVRICDLIYFQTCGYPFVLFWFLAVPLFGLPTHLSCFGFSQFPYLVCLSICLVLVSHSSPIRFAYPFVLFWFLTVPLFDLPTHLSCFGFSQLPYLVCLPICLDLFSRSGLIPTHYIDARIINPVKSNLVIHAG